MSVRRTRPLAEKARAAALELSRSEAQIALLDRVRPLNWQAEQIRLTRAFEARQQPAPAFEYAPRAELSRLRARLIAIATELDQADLEQRLLAERAQELELEATLAEQVAGPEFARLAARRFSPGHDAARTEQTAQQLLRAGPQEPNDDAGVRHLSDDRRDPHSLWSQVSRLLARGLGNVQIEPVLGLVSLAAVANGVVRIRARAPLSASVGRRIALHEVEGHVRPRSAGATLGGIFSAGAVRASEDEEGRAILLEERAGLLGAQRRRELGYRYLAAESVRGGAEFWDTVRLLGTLGAEAAPAIELACRVHRGGGLARELVYLTGYLRVARALAVRPELEQVLQSGRVSLEAADALLTDGVELDDDGDVV